MKDIQDPGTLDLENYIKSTYPKSPFDIDTTVFKSLSADDKDNAYSAVCDFREIMDGNEAFDDFLVQEHPFYQEALSSKFILPNSLDDIEDKPDLSHKVFMMLLLMADANGYVINAKARLEGNIPFSWNKKNLTKRHATLKKHIVTLERELSALPIPKNNFDESFNAFCEWILISDFKRKIRDPLIRNISDCLSILEKQGYLIRRYFNIYKDEAERGHPDASGYWKNNDESFRLFRNGILDVFLTEKALEYRATLQGDKNLVNSLVSEVTETVR